MHVLVEQKQIKLLSKWHFAENKTEIMQHVLKNAVNFLFA
jgi:hypothetical protein